MKKKLTKKELEVQFVKINAKEIKRLEKESGIKLGNPMTPKQMKDYANSTGQYFYSKHKQQTL